MFDVNVSTPKGLVDPQGNEIHLLAKGIKNKPERPLPNK
jgi:hypothetical protein